jgi:hypothetical protein
MLGWEGHLNEEVDLCFLWRRSHGVRHPAHVRRGDHGGERSGIGTVTNELVGDFRILQWPPRAVSEELPPRTLTPELDGVGATSRTESKIFRR